MRNKLQKDSAGQFYFEIQASGNHQTLVTSEGYKERADALAAIKLIRIEVDTAEMVEVLGDEDL